MTDTPTTPRVEDGPLLSGTARFLDDVEPHGTLHMVFVRSIAPHARILGIDTTAALELPGIRAVLTGDAVARHSGPVPIGWENVPGQRSTGSLAMAREKVRYVGHQVAAVVADDRATAEDAAELVVVDYDWLPAVMDPAEAVADGAPLLHESWPDNVLGSEVNASGDVATALRDAEHVVELDLRIGRAFACPLETRGVVADWRVGRDEHRAGQGRLDVLVSSQSPNRVREMLAETLGLGIADVRVRVPAVGGGFGAKANYYGEEVVAAIASKVCGRPVKWIEDRSESFVATSHARESQLRVTVGAAADGTVGAFRNDLVGALGGEVSSVGMGPVWVSTRAGAGSYVLPNAEITTTGVMTNRTPFGSYRGWGSPLANFGIERALDALADRLGLHPVEVRLRNMVTPQDMPFDNGLGWRLDSGDYPAALRRVRRSVEEAGWLDEVAAARAEGRVVGIGYANFVEATGVGNSRSMARNLSMEQGGFDEARVRLDSTGTVLVFTGQISIGQGLETTLGRVCAETLGAREQDVRVLSGDTDSCPYTGYGTGGCRTAPVAASSVKLASEQLRAQLLDVASELLGEPAEALAVEGGRVTAADGSSVGFDEIGRAAYRRLDQLPDRVSPTLEARAVWDPIDRTYGYGSVAVLVEVDDATGMVDVRRYHVVDDCGRVIDQAIVDGQVMGAFTQILGSTLFEELRYLDDGTPVSTSFKDYLLPLATDVPTMTVEHVETLPPDVPSGSKGVGEAGTIAGMAAIAQAVEDAVGDGYGWVRQIPISPEHLLRRLGRVRAGERTPVREPATT